MFLVLMCNHSSAFEIHSQKNDPYAEFMKLLDIIKKKQSDSDVYLNLNDLMEIYKNRYTVQSAEYASSVLFSAFICAQYGDNKQALHLLQHASDLFSQYGKGPFDGRDTVNEIFRLDLQSKIKLNTKCEYDAVLLLDKSCALKRDYFGDKSEPYLNALLDISSLYAQRLRHLKSARLHNMGYEPYVERIKYEFCSASESGRITYWNKAANYIGKTLDLAYKSKRGNSWNGKYSISAAAYNAALLSKGILLNTSISFDNHIINSGNSGAIELLEQKRKLINQPGSSSMCDSLDYLILDILCKNNNKFELPHLSINWKDVAEKLSYDDLAIEFFRTNDGNYGALMLKRGWKSPSVVKLKKYLKISGVYYQLEDLLTNFPLSQYDPVDNELYWNMGRAIWTDEIVKHFPVTDKGKIFFSCDGALHIYAIEYLLFIKPGFDKNYCAVSDLYNIYRLSSTRELLNDDDIFEQFSHKFKAALYGGVKYNASEDLINYADSLNDVKKRYAALGLNELPYTMHEVDSLFNIFEKNHYIAKRFVEEGASEAAVRSVSSGDYNVLHIATHGYYHPSDDQSEDLSMDRSGLYMSGAQQTLLYADASNVANDGILSAKEVSGLDLHSLDLVTLSACQTGLGHISKDGVFGLQRGFKKAGANSILMSLWKVDDAATCFLMTEFYRHWIGGESKHRALQLAKEAVRAQKDKGWNNPKYWAAFILLDGLDNTNN